MRFLASLLAIGLLAAACGTSTSQDQVGALASVDNEAAETTVTSTSVAESTTTELVSTRETEDRVQEVGATYEGQYPGLLPILSEQAEPYVSMFLTTAEIEAILDRSFPNAWVDSFRTSTVQLDNCGLEEVVEQGSMPILRRYTQDDLNFFAISQDIYIAENAEDAQRFFSAYAETMSDQCRGLYGALEFTDLESPNGALRVRRVLPLPLGDEDIYTETSTENPELELGQPTVESSAVESVIIEGNIILVTSIGGIGFEFYTPGQADELLTLAEVLFLETIAADS